MIKGGKKIPEQRSIVHDFNCPKEVKQEFDELNDAWGELSLS